MSNPVQSSSNRRKTAWLGAAALAALIAGGAVESGFVPPAVPAYAQAPIAVSATQPMPSFADVVDKVKPAVVSVRVKLENAVSNEDGFQSFGSGNLDQLPPQLREFFKRFGENGMPQRRARTAGAWLRLLHLRGWLRGHQQPRRRPCEDRAGDDR